MRGSSLDREAVEAEIDRVRSLGFDELRALWRTTLRSSPPSVLSKDLVARFLCWHLQEQALGGLDANCAKLLDGLARGDKGATDRPRRLKPGTVLVRISGRAADPALFSAGRRYARSTPGKALREQTAIPRTLCGLYRYAFCACRPGRQSPATRAYRAADLQPPSVEPTSADRPFFRNARRTRE